MLYFSVLRICINILIKTLLFSVLHIACEVIYLWCSVPIPGGVHSAYNALETRIQFLNRQFHNVSFKRNAIMAIVLSYITSDRIKLSILVG